MRTKQLIRFLVFLLTLCSLAFCHSAAQARDGKPNIIVFYSDDHGYADIGIHGQAKDLKTPHLDDLARSGVIARHGYSTAPQCVPSRGGLMVGKFQGRFNLDNNNSELTGFNEQTTIAQRLRDAGYATAQFGKWHLGPTDKITSHGFMHSFSQAAQRDFHANITLEGKDVPITTMQPELYHVDACSRAASSIIERYKEQPFFLYVAFRAPHVPLDAPENYTRRFPGPMPERRRQALAMLSAVDDGIGLIQQTLAKYNLKENTLIFFVGDNGAPLKIHKADDPFQKDGGGGGWDGSLNTPLNGEKGMLSEGGMHVPFLVSWPGMIPGGQSYDHPISTLDIAATAAELAKVSVRPGDLDGVNLVPYLKGEKTSAPHDALMWRWTAQSAIREGKWKLLRGGEREYLFDLSRDLEEKHNLAKSDPETTKRLRDKLGSWCGELVPPGLALSPMAKTWNEYYDYYLDGKPAPAKAANESAGNNEPMVNGWQARGGSLAEDSGQLVFNSAGAKGFITKTKLDLKAPAVVKLSVKTSVPGELVVQWRLAGEKDFVSSNELKRSIADANTWDTQTIQLPNKEPIIHLRIHFPKGTTLIRSLEVK